MTFICATQPVILQLEPNCLNSHVSFHSSVLTFSTKVERKVNIVRKVFLKKALKLLKSYLRGHFNNDINYKNLAKIRKMLVIKINS